MLLGGSQSRPLFEEATIGSAAYNSYVADDLPPSVCEGAFPYAGV